MLTLEHQTYEDSVFRRHKEAAMSNAIKQAKQSASLSLKKKIASMEEQLKIDDSGFQTEILQVQRSHEKKKAELIKVQKRLLAETMSLKSATVARVDGATWDGAEAPYKISFQRNTRDVSLPDDIVTEVSESQSAVLIVPSRAIETDKVDAPKRRSKRIRVVTHTLKTKSFVGEDEDGEVPIDDDDLISPSQRFNDAD